MEPGGGGPPTAAGSGSARCSWFLMGRQGAGQASWKLPESSGGNGTQCRQAGSARLLICHCSRAGLRTLSRAGETSH